MPTIPNVTSAFVTAKTITKRSGVQTRSSSSTSNDDVIKILVSFKVEILSAQKNFVTHSCYNLKF